MGSVMPLVAPEQARAFALAERAQGGDGEAFAEIVRSFHGAVYRLCWRYLRGEEAEDATQETFMRAFVHRQRFDPTRPLQPWLLTIAKRLCLDRMRKKRPVLSDRPEGPEAVESSPDAEQMADTRQRLGRLQKALEELPENQREAVSLYHLEGLSYQQIAESLEVPLGTIMTWLHRGRSRLKKELTAPGDGAVGPGHLEAEGVAR
jgi:RNA polymerase sigma-70 factor (ECF subfamily)